MLTLSAPRRVAIVGANRIPFARSNTAYAEASNQDMLTAALQGLIDRFDLHGLRLGEVAAGAVLKLSRDIALTRESVLGTTLGRDTPAYDVQQACGTGLEAAILVANKIALGQIEVGIAGGVDTTSDAPIALNEGFRRALLTANRQKSTPGRLKALSRAGLTAPFRPEPRACRWASIANGWPSIGPFRAMSRTPWRSAAIAIWRRPMRRGCSTR